MKKHLLRTIVGLVVLLLFLGHAAEYEYMRMPLVDTLEALAYDIRLRLTMPRTVDHKVVILDIDEKSLQEKELGGEGRWPWSRDRLALLMDKLFDKYEVAVVGFDVVFSERDESSGVRVLDRLAEQELKGVPAYLSTLGQLKAQLDYDGLFAGKLKGRNVVMGFLFTVNDPSPPKGMLPAPALTMPDLVGDVALPLAVRRSGYTANLPELQKSAVSGGHFNPTNDADGIMRRVPMLLEYKDAFYEPLSLAMVRLMLGSPPIKPVFLENVLEALDVGPFRIPVDGDWSALVPYRGERGSFKYYSLVDVINERIDVAELKGKIALVGTSAPGIFDLRATPVGGVYPGVEVHANLIAGILDESIKSQPPYMWAMECLLLLVVGGVLVVVQPRLTFLAGIATAIVLLGLALGTNVAIFHYYGLVVPLASGVTMILVLFTFNMAYGFFVEGAGKRKVAARFGQYVPPEVAEEMAEAPDNYNMEGESREMTVLFTDVRGFTSISEGLEPRALSQLMNAFLTPLTEVIYRHRGTIDKYMGDCIMAFWGAPVRNPEHARYGILAALEMQQKLKNLQSEFRAKNWPEVRIGVGLNTGRMSVGNMGSRIRLAYTVMGDAVNLSSRLEGITKEYGADIIVGEGTKAAVTGIVFMELDRVRVKGKEVAVAMFEPLGLEGEVPQAMLDEIDAFHEASALYRKQDWEKAEAQFRKLEQMAPDRKLYQVFLKRIEDFRANPPGADWDGAFTFETK